MDMRLPSPRLALALCLLLGSTTAPAGREPGVAGPPAVVHDAQAQPPAKGGQPTRTAPPREREHIVEGTKANDVLEGGEGDDWLFGYEGDDVLRAGPGRDTLDGGPGDDSLAGAAGHDVLDGGPGRDTLSGGADNDFMDGGEGDDSIDGGPENDDIDGGDGDDLLTGGAGDDVLVGGDGNDTQSGGEGADRLLGRDSDDRLSGGAGDDVVDGGDGRDSLTGDAGNDRLTGGEGEDVASGGAGNDVLNGGSGTDVLLGDTGNDTLLGSSGADSLDGGEEHDTLLGGAGRDLLSGGPGDDVLIGGTGTDTVRADTEDDLIVLRAGDVAAGENELIDGGAGQDTLILNGFSSTDSRDAIPDPVTGGTYRLLDLEQVQHVHVFPGFTSSEAAPAAFVFVNPFDTPNTGRVVFLDHDGGPLAQSVNGSAAQPTYSFTVAARGRTALTATGPAQSGHGTALVLADRPLTGLLDTVRADPGRLGTGEARLLDNFVVPVRQSQAEGIDTGVALFASTVASNVKLTLRRSSGQEVSRQNEGAVEIDIPANGHRIVFVSELFAWAGENFEGALTIEGGIDRPEDGGPLAGIGLHRDLKAGTVNTFPVVAISPGTASGPLYFANFPVGGEYRSAITLINPSPTTIARGALMFFDPAGESRAVAINGQAPATSVSWEIGPFGSAVFSASGSGALRPGTARVLTRDGVTGGVVSLTSTTTALRAPPSDLGESFIAAVHRHAASGVNTHVAVTATATPVTVTLTLQDASGAELSGGQATLTLGANAAVGQTIDALFPKADTSNLQGTLTVRAEGGTVALTLTRASAGSRALTWIPAARLRE